MTRLDVRKALDGSLLDKVTVHVRERDEEWISDQAVAILDRIGYGREFPASLVLVTGLARLGWTRGGSPGIFG